MVGEDDDYEDDDNDYEYDNEEGIDSGDDAALTEALELNRSLRVALDDQNAHSGTNHNFHGNRSSNRLQKYQQSLVLPPLEPGRGSLVVAAALGERENNRAPALTRKQQQLRQQMQQSSSEAHEFDTATRSSGSGSDSNKVELGPDGKPRRTRENYTFPSREINRIERENQLVLDNIYSVKQQGFSHAGQWIVNVAKTRASGLRRHRKIKSNKLAQENARLAARLRDIKPTMQAELPKGPGIVNKSQQQTKNTFKTTKKSMNQQPVRSTTHGTTVASFEDASNFAAMLEARTAEVLARRQREYQQEHIAGISGSRDHSDLHNTSKHKSRSSRDPSVGGGSRSAGAGRQQRRREANGTRSVEGQSNGLRQLPLLELSQLE